MVTKYRLGVQPAHGIIRGQGRSINGTARVIGVNPQHLHQVLRGRVRPSPRVREQLPALLGVPLHKLFTEHALEPFKERRLAS